MLKLLITEPSSIFSPTHRIERQILADATAWMLPMSWQRTNLYGEVDLPDEALLDYLRFDLDALFAFQ
jgi:hypothetical protein